jgi:hypothetical protein
VRRPAGRGGRAASSIASACRTSRWTRWRSTSSRRPPAANGRSTRCTTACGAPSPIATHAAGVRAGRADAGRRLQHAPRPARRLPALRRRAPHAAGAPRAPAGRRHQRRA